MKRFVGVVVALILLPAGTATAHQGAPDLIVSIVDEGTCHRTATLLGNPGVTVFGPFFVLPFPTTVVRP